MPRVILYVCIILYSMFSVLAKGASNPKHLSASVATAQNLTVYLETEANLNLM